MHIYIFKFLLLLPCVSYTSISLTTLDINNIAYLYSHCIILKHAILFKDFSWITNNDLIILNFYFVVVCYFLRTWNRTKAMPVSYIIHRHAKNNTERATHFRPLAFRVNTNKESSLFSLACISTHRISAGSPIIAISSKSDCPSLHVLMLISTLCCSAQLRVAEKQPLLRRKPWFITVSNEALSIALKQNYSK